jgi:hypothetical protein
MLYTLEATWSDNGTGHTLTPFLLMSTKWWAPASASKWQIGFNSAFKGLSVM